MREKPVLSRPRTALRAIIALVTAAILVGATAAPASADPVLIWDGSTADFELTISSNSNDPTWAYSVDITNLTSETQHVGFAADLRQQGVPAPFWQGEEWQVFNDSGNRVLAPGESYREALLPAWSGMTYGFYTNIDDDPILINEYLVPGRYLPFDFTGGYDDIPGSLQVGYPVTTGPAGVRAGEQVHVAAFLGDDWPTSNAEVWISDPLVEGDSTQFEAMLLRGLSGAADDPDIAPITDRFHLLGIVPVAGDTADGALALPADLAPGSYSVLIGDSSLDLWPAGPRIEIDNSAGANLTVEPGESRGATTESGVPVSPRDQYGNTPVSLTFDSVDAAGVSSVTTSTSGPSSTVFAQLGGTNAVYYELATTAGFSGSIQVCITYDPTDLTPEEQDLVTLYHFDGGAWVPITDSRPEPGVVCGFTDSLSPFTLGFPLAEFTTSSVPTISGTKAVGSTLTLNRRTWDPVLAAGDFSYQWNRDGSAIAGASGTSYALVPDDAGSRITVTVTATKAGYIPRSEASAPTGYISGGVWTATGSASISGAPAVGQYLFADTTGWAPTPTTLRYQWYRASDGTTTGASSSNRYTVRAVDAGFAVYAIVTASKPGFPNVTVQTDPVQVEGALVTTKPTITGTPLGVGSTLTAVPGTWGPDPVTLSYQWLRNGAAIDGATGAQYLLVPDDAGQSITVSITGSKPQFTSVTRTSSSKTILGLLAPPPTPIISGTPAVGQTLAVDAGTWGPGTVTLRYQWFRNGVPLGGLRSANTYKLVSADAGQVLTVQVTGSQAGYSPATSAPSAGFAVESVLVTSAPTITGSPLAVGTTLSVSPTWGPGDVSYSYQWNRGAVAIAGAGSSSYQLVAEDAGQSITVTVTGSQPGYTTVTRTSAAKTIQSVFTVVPQPSIVGTSAVGQVLSVDKGTWSPTPTTYSYVWKRDGVQVGTGATYTVKSADLGHVITVTVSGSSSGFTKATSVPSVGVSVP